MTDRMVEIFGQDLCPYTAKAREDLRGRKVNFNYINVLEDRAGLERDAQNYQRASRHSRYRRSRQSDYRLWRQLSSLVCRRRR